MLYNGELFLLLNLPCYPAATILHTAQMAAGEIIAAQNCTLQGDGSYWLTNLMRGAMGLRMGDGTAQHKRHAGIA